MVEVSAGTSELCRYFGILNIVRGKNLGIQIDSSQLSDEEAKIFLEKGDLPIRVTDRLHEDKQPAMVCSLKQTSEN